MGLLVSGCGSIVESVREPRKPASGQVLSGTAYYLPKGKIKVTGAWNKEQRLWDISITPIIEADPSARYYVNRNVNVMFDDDITVAIDPSTGLLQTVNAASTDRTVDALAGLVSAAASGLTFGAGLGPVATGGALAQEQQTNEFNQIKGNAFFSTFQTVLDAQGGSQVAYVMSPDPETNRFYAKFLINLVPLDPDPSNEKPTFSPTSVPGILVRRTIPNRVIVTASVYRHTGPPAATFGAPELTVMLPDEKHDYSVKFERAPFVSNTTKVTLVNGISQSQQRIRPSIVMGIVGLPKNILSALAPIPLQIRNDQVNLLTAEEKILTIRANIEKLQTPPGISTQNE
jgi:hypothetical protein